MKGERKSTLRLAGSRTVQEPREVTSSLHPGVCLNTPSKAAVNCRLRVQSTDRRNTLLNYSSCARTETRANSLDILLPLWCLHCLLCSPLPLKVTGHLSILNTEKAIRGSSAQGHSHFILLSLPACDPALCSRKDYAFSWYLFLSSSSLITSSTIS